MDIFRLQLSAFFHKGWLSAVLTIFVRILPRTMSKYLTLFRAAGGQNSVRERNSEICAPERNYGEETPLRGVSLTDGVRMTKRIPLSQCPILRSNPLCLRAPGAGITEIDLLAATQRDAIDLFVSQNQIANLENIIQFNSLQRLLISFNQIHHIEDLFPLGKLASLRELNLEGNPVCRLPLFTIHVFYLIPSLEVLNGRKVRTFPTFRIPRDKLGFYVNSETNLLRLLATSDLLAECLSTKPKILSLAALFRRRFPPQAFVDYCHHIRQKGQRFQTQQYFQYLKDLLLDKHRRIHHDADRQDDIDEAAVARHFHILNKLGQTGDLESQVPLYEELAQICPALLHARKKDRDRSKSRSRLSDRFSIASSLRSRSSISSPRSPFPPKAEATEDAAPLPPPEREEEPPPVHVEEVTEPEASAVTESPPPAVKDVPVPDVSVVLCPDFDLVAKSFGKWKLRARVGRQQMDLIGDLMEIAGRVAAARQSQQPPAQDHLLKDLCERRSLMRQVEMGREVVGLSRARYRQLKREIEVIKAQTSVKATSGIFQ
jgi:hypothetical protein